MPTGGLEINLIIQRPRQMIDMKIGWRISVRFGRSFRRDKEAHIPANPPTITTLKFSNSKI